MFEDADWTYRADYIFNKHGITIEQATEALTDPDKVTIDPDYASESGQGVRIIGYSQTFEDILTVIVIREGGVVYGANAWRANSKDRDHYHHNAGQ